MIPIQHLEPGALNLRPSLIRNGRVSLPPEGMAESFQLPLPRNLFLDGLVVNQGSPVLLVSLHGATDREKYQLPRFEWLNTLIGTPHSSLYFSDPTLLLGDGLQLSWYTGWDSLDLYAAMASVVREAVAGLNVDRVVVLGSSGGGFAALQLSSYLPGSVALAMNAQTRISAYTVHGSLGVQRRYMNIVMPFLNDPHGRSLEERTDDWSLPMGDRLSAVRRYSTPVTNHVYLLQNTNDVHHYEDHFLPFRDAAVRGGNDERCRFVPYDGPANHNPPTRDVFAEHLAHAVEWAPATIAACDSLA